MAHPLFNLYREAAFESFERGGGGEIPKGARMQFSVTFGLGEHESEILAFHAEQSASDILQDIQTADTREITDD
jgi:hypothetical protein